MEKIISQLLIAFTIFGIRGCFEGFIFDSEKGRENENLIHRLGTVLVAVYYLSIFDFTLTGFIRICSMHLTFFYVHLGTYHQTRHALNEKVYPLGFKDWRPSTSKSWWDNYVFKYAPLTYRVRLILFIIGTIIYIWTYYFNF